MAKQQLGYHTRRALWEAHGFRCGYCRDPVTYANLEIDHILPEKLKKLPKSKWRKACNELGISPDFDLYGLGNLLPSCKDCNRRKNDFLLDYHANPVVLGVADRLKDSVAILATKFRNQIRADQQRFAIASAITNGALSIAELSALVSEQSANIPKFKISSPLEILGEIGIGYLSSSDFERCLSMKLNFPEWSDGYLELTHDNGKTTRVSTLKSYESAIAKGFYATSNADMKIASALFEMPLDLVNHLRSATLAKRSFVDEPRKGVCDVDLLPASTLCNSSWFQNNGRNIGSLKNKTVGDLLRSGVATLTFSASDQLTVHFDNHVTHLFEMARADFSRAGFQEILVSSSGAPLDGTIFYSATSILSRRSNTALFKQKK